MKSLDILLFNWVAAGTNPQGGVLIIAAFWADWGASAVAITLIVGLCHRYNTRYYLLSIIICALSAQIAARYLASVIDLPRPFVSGMSPMWIDHAPNGSLPSKHATVMSTVAFMCLARAELRLYGWLIAAFTLFTGWGRIYVGIHFPFDILSGFVLGSLVSQVGVIVHRICSSSFRRRKVDNK